MSQNDLVARVRAFVDEYVIPAEPDLHRDAAAVLPGLRKLAKAAGLWALGHPAEIGGGGLPFADYVPVNEVQGRSEYGQYALGTHSLQDSLMLHAHATPAVRDRYLAPLVAADLTPAFAMTEPGLSSSDPTGLRTTARLDGDEWVISGRKWFVTGARDAAYTTVMCRTELADTPAHHAFSIILVPAGTPGFRVVREIPVLGIDHDHHELAFDEVRVPADHLVGPRGAGFRVAQERLGPGRIFHAMRWLGQATRAYELMVARLRERTAFGGPLADKQLMQQHVFEAHAAITAARLLTLDAARVLDEGGAARVEIGVVKVVGARMLNDVVDRALQVFGAEGLSDDTPLGFMYRTARFARIYDGPDEVHIQSVAKALLNEKAAVSGPLSTSGTVTSGERDANQPQVRDQAEHSRPNATNRVNSGEAELCGPLAGIRVVELASLAPGPFAAMVLADLGAEVVRVDRPGATIDPADLLGRGRDVITADLKDPAGRDRVLRLVDHADVLIEGFRPGVTERLGLGPDVCLAHNPSLVYGRMTGWGQDGPLAPTAGHDINYISLAGALHPVGPADEPPVPPLNLVGDFGGGGMLLALGCLAALLERGRSGAGQVVDAAMVDGAGLLTTHLHTLLAQGIWPGERGRNLLDGGAPFYRTYATADGRYVSVGAIEPQFYAALLDRLGLADDGLPAQMDRDRWPDLHAVFAARFAEHTRDHWGRVFSGTDACVTPVLTPAEATTHPHQARRGGFTSVAGIPAPAPAPRFGRSTPQAPRPAAVATPATLEAWGLSTEDVKYLVDGGT